MVGFGFWLMTSWLFCFLWFASSVSLTGSSMENNPIGHFRVALNLFFKTNQSAKSLLWKSVFNHIEIWTNYHNKNFALRLALKERLRGTRKWPIDKTQFNLHRYDIRECDSNVATHVTPATWCGHCCAHARKLNPPRQLVASQKRVINNTFSSVILASQVGLLRGKHIENAVCSVIPVKPKRKPTFLVAYCLLGVSCYAVLLSEWVSVTI